MNESPTRSGIDVQFGQGPSSPPLSASPVESRASPVPCPYWTSSNGSLSSSRKSQPTTSSAKPLPSSSAPSVKAISTSCGSSSGRPSSTGPSPSGGAGSTRGSQAEASFVKTPSPLPSQASVEEVEYPAEGSDPFRRVVEGCSSSPRFRRNFARRSFIAPRSFHLMPESSTAIVTSGRPVDVCHPVATDGSLSTSEAPRTPPSSRGSALTSALPCSGVAAYIHSSLPSRSLGAAPSYSYGKAAHALPAKLSHSPTTNSSLIPLPVR